MKKLLVILATCIYLAFYSFAYGAWEGPSDVVVGPWGKDPGQIGIEHGDTVDQFPRSFGVSNSGKIAVADFINEVLHVFRNNGYLLVDIKKPVQRKWWPYTVIVGWECAVVPYVEFTHTFDLSTGNLVGTANNIGGGNYLSDDCKKIYVSQDNNVWKVYSLSGELLQTYTERPLELGQVKEKYLGPGRYKITVKFPDKTWEIIGAGAFPKYMRDLNGNLYGIGDTQVVRYDNQGNELARLTIPEGRHEEEPRGPGVEPKIKVIEGYGSPVVAPNGDVYTWKRTPDKYYIIKWVWQ
jgi:hypothetical protein